MTRLLYLLSTGIAGAIAYTLLTSATIQVSQTNEYTSELTRASEGRQISLVAPAPQAPLLTGLGVMFGLGAIGSLWKVLDDKNKDSSTPTVTGTVEDYYPMPVIQPVSIENSIPLNVGTVPAPSSPLMSSKLQPLVVTGLVSVIGGQGSGKSTLNAALIRERIKMGHKVIVINHHAAFKEYFPIPVYGDGDNLEEQIAHCEEGLRKLIDMREERYAVRKRQPQSEWEFMQQPITFLIEELGEYKGVVDSVLMSRVIKTICAGVRKANIYVILSSQYDTMEMFGGTSGMAKMLQEGFIKITLGNKPDPTKPSGLGPTGQGILSINGGAPVTVKIPDLSAMFPPGQSEYDFTDLFSNSSNQERELSAVTETTEDNVAPIVILERSLSLPSYEPEQTLTKDESSILDCALGFQGHVTARDITRANGSQLNPDEIRLIFVRLADLGYGSIEGEGKRLTFNAY